MGKTYRKVLTDKSKKRKKRIWKKFCLDTSTTEPTTSTCINGTAAPKSTCRTTPRQSRAKPASVMALIPRVAFASNSIVSSLCSLCSNVINYSLYAYLDIPCSITREIVITSLVRQTRLFLVFIFFGTEQENIVLCTHIISI